MSKPIAEAKFYAMTAEAAVKTLQSDAGRGLSGSEAKKRLGVYGENRLQKGKKTSFAKKFMLQFGDFMVLILLIASAVSFAVSCMQGEANLAAPLLILGIVIANAFVGTVQEAKAERALEALRTLSAPHADVLRDGKRYTLHISARETQGPPTCGFWRACTCRPRKARRRGNLCRAARVRMRYVTKRAARRSAKTCCFPARASLPGRARAL